MNYMNQLSDYNTQDHCEPSTLVSHRQLDELERMLGRQAMACDLALICAMLGCRSNL